MQLNPKESVVLVGGGLSALMSAYYIKKIAPDKKLHIIESSSKLGGKYSSFSYDDDMYFDQGMHVIYESCDKEIDNIYREILPENEWNIFHKNEKDIAGIFYKNKLQQYSHYIDLRNSPDDKYASFLSSVFSSLKGEQKTNSAEAYLRSRFGDVIYEENHALILKNLYGLDASELSDFVIKLTALERVLLFDESEMLDLMNSSLIRSRIGFPNQLELPDIRPNTQKALYPKKYGMHHFINAFEKKLKELDVSIHKNAEVKSVNVKSGYISAVDFKTDNIEELSLSIGTLVWYAGVPSIASKLGVSFKDIRYEQGRKMVYVNVIFDKPLNSGRLYYFYCYDQGFATHRVTNYSEYCPDEKLSNRYRCCVELWPEKIGLDPNELTHQDYLDLAILELKAFGVVSDNEVVFSSVEEDVGSFPLPSVSNQNAMNELRVRLKEVEVRNLLNIGVLSEEGLFFLPDVLNDAFAKLRCIFK